MHFRRNRAPFPPRTGISRAPSSHGVGRGLLPQVICRGIRPKPREIGISEVIYGESRPRPRRSRAGRAVLSDGRERNICHSPDGNRLCANPVPRFGGELATNELYAHFEAGMGRVLPASNRSCAPLSGGMGRNGGCDGRRGGSAREGGPGRGARSAHMFDPQPEGGLFRPSDWHMVRFSPARPDRGRYGRSRGPIAPARPRPNGRALARTPLGGRTPGSNPAWRQDPWFEPRLVASRSGEIGSIWQLPRLLNQEKSSTPPRIARRGASKCPFSMEVRRICPSRYAEHY